MNYKRLLISLIAFSIASNAYAAALPDDCAQLIVALAPDWNAVHGRLYLLDKIGGKWRANAGPMPALFGKNGLAWGSGIVGQDEPGRENMSEMVERPQAFSESAKFLPMMPRCHREQTIHFIR